MSSRALVAAGVLILFADSAFALTPRSRRTSPLTAGAPHDISAGALHRDIALIVTEPFGNARRDAILHAIEGVGGTVYLIYPPNVMVGRIPAPLHTLVDDIPGVRFVTAQAVDAGEAAVSDENALHGLRYFNWVVSGEQAKEFNRVKDVVVPLSALGRHTFGATGTSGLTAAASSMPDVEVQTHTAFPNDVLDGLTAVDVFFLEIVDDPATSANEDEFTWTVAHHNDHANRITDGFWWWMDVATSRGVYLTYTLRFFPGSYWQQQVPFEPIRRNAFPEDFEWISRVTANHGVTAGTTSGERAAAYGAAIRTQLGAKNGFPVFSPYNPDWAPKYHTNWLSAYAVLGTYINLLYENIDFPLEQTGWVFAHEMGHVFWACDEYQDECHKFMEPACSNCYGTFSGDPEAAANGPGPREASMNWNCELCTPNGPDACLMHATTASNWTNRSTCVHTRRMIGWPE